MPNFEKEFYQAGYTITIQVSTENPVPKKKKS
jgi:hypothetical protein